MRSEKLVLGFQPMPPLAHEMTGLDVSGFAQVYPACFSATENGVPSCGGFSSCNFNASF